LEGEKDHCAIAGNVSLRDSLFWGLKRHKGQGLSLIIDSSLYDEKGDSWHPINQKRGVQLSEFLRRPRGSTDDRGRSSSENWVGSDFRRRGEHTLSANLRGVGVELKVKEKGHCTRYGRPLLSDKGGGIKY